jgi:hypothetical protein
MEGTLFLRPQIQIGVTNLHVQDAHMDSQHTSSALSLVFHFVMLDCPKLHTLEIRACLSHPIAQTRQVRSPRDTADHAFTRRIIITIFGERWRTWSFETSLKLLSTVNAEQHHQQKPHDYGRCSSMTAFHQGTRFSQTTFRPRGTPAGFAAITCDLPRYQSDMRYYSSAAAFVQMSVTSQR